MQRVGNNCSFFIFGIFLYIWVSGVPRCLLAPYMRKETIDLTPAARILQVHESDAPHLSDRTTLKAYGIPSL
eukprot:4129600-Amphidinium_carterae.1